MDPSSQTYKSVVLGKLVLSSGVVRESWKKISELKKRSKKVVSDVEFEIYTKSEDEFTFLVFGAAPPRFNIDSFSFEFSELTGLQNHNPFRFLCSQTVSSFSVHSSAFKLFKSVYNVLPQIKSKILNSKKPLIITGNGVGGSVACLYTLWLLDTIKPGQTLPMCITFGSPLIGDTSLQQILENSVRNSCFLHVVSIQDSVPKHLFKQPNNISKFKPFGTFLICFESECICIDDPESIEEMLVDVNRDEVSMEWKDYNKILQRLEEPAANGHICGSRPQDEETARLIRDVMVRMEDRASKKLRFDPLKKLNDIKILMAHLEWYKKESRKDKIGYYDRFKNQMLRPHSSTDMKVMQFKEEMNDYWKSVVEQVKKKPQSETEILKRRSLFAANNYRRMVEPLDIAEYYLNGNKNYKTSGRSNHYIMLENWFKETTLLPVKSIKSAKRDMNMNDLLMIDSCFWAEVEEAMIALKLLKTSGLRGDKRGELIGELVKFEKYVQDLIGKCQVSPEIFLEKSSFMKWWGEYEEFKGNEYSSHFFEFMKKKSYKSYGQSK